MLKQLKLIKSLEIKRSKLEEIKVKYDAITKRSEDAQQALNESKTEDDLKIVEAEITEIEKEETQINDEKKTVETEIEQLEIELEEVEKRSKETSKQTRKKDTGVDTGMNRLQVRELLKTGEYYKRSDVIEFYEKFKNLRALGAELTIPEVVVSRIMDVLGDFSTLYPIVDVLRISGSGRIILDVDDTPATWVEGGMGGAIPEGDVGTLVSIDFDGYKIGKISYIDNHILSDSIINLDSYIVRKIAKSIGKGLDLSILSGTGAAGKQPTGILPNLPVENTVDVEVGANLAELVAPVGVIDTGLDGNIGEISAVMRRSTFYAHLLPLSITFNSSGQAVGTLPNLTQPNILGLQVVFNNSMPADSILYGDFKKYTLVERENITIDSSSEAGTAFVQDKTAFRGKGRFDGKPVMPEAFCLVNLTTTPAV